MRAALRHAQSCPTLCDPTDCSPPGSSVHGVLPARILEWAAIYSSRASSWLRDRTQSPALAYGFFLTESPGKPQSREIPWDKGKQGFFFKFQKDKHTEMTDVMKTQETEYHVMTEAETGMLEPHGCWQRPEARRIKEGLSPPCFRGSTALWSLISDFWPSKLWDNFFCFKSPNFCCFFMANLGN